MTQIETDRLNDFKKILTYHLVSKINHNFKGNYKLYYKAPKIWADWREHKIAYDNKIYKIIIAFNQTALTKNQCSHIFGKVDGKWLRYENVIKSDSSIKIFNKGTICMNDQRIGVAKRYQLPFEFIKSIFDDKELLKKVLDAGSDYYTPRQRRLIFTQINKQRNYHYKTKQDAVKEKSDKELYDEIINEMGDIEL